MKRIVLMVAAIVSLGATACGGHDDHSGMNTEGSTTTGAGVPATRTVEITMVDIAFDPKTLSVQRGDRIEFVFHNKGTIVHDAFIADAAAQADHEKEMREDKGGGHHMEGEGNAITVDPAKTGRLTYTFDKPGTIEIGCHQPGHYTAGMKVAVTVT